MKVLLVEDEREIALSIQEYLLSNNFICERAHNLSSAINKITLYEYDCILLDLSLPDGSGFELLKILKKQNKMDGVIIISAKETLEARIQGFQLGADDYLTKPFHLSELLMRILALVRRKNFHASNLVTFNEIQIDIFARTVTVNESEINLTKKEQDLLLLFIANVDRVLSKSAIAEHLSGDMADMLDNHDFVYAHIKNLKRKLSDAGSGDYIKSIYGIGYKWSHG